MPFRALFALVPAGVGGFGHLTSARLNNNNNHQRQGEGIAVCGSAAAA